MKTGFYRWDRRGSHRDTYAGLPVAGFHMPNGPAR